MAKTSRTKAKSAKSAPAKTTKPVPPTRAVTIDELAHALHGVVTGSEARGGRDRPEVSKAHALLTKLGFVV